MYKVLKNLFETTKKIYKPVLTKKKNQYLEFQEKCCNNRCFWDKVFFCILLLKSNYYAHST